MRGVKTFAYDLYVSVGGVSSRVALLLRSTEPKPICPSFEKYLPINRLLRQLFRGVFKLVSNMMREGEKHIQRARERIFTGGVGLVWSQQSE